MHCARRKLNKEADAVAKHPIPGINISANVDDTLEWHFVIHGKEDTPYYGGMYHGKLIFPSNFPFNPPSIIFLTPNGRFKTNERICFSISDFHPEQWKPSYSLVDLLYGVREFMHENTETTGSIETSVSKKRHLAKSSHTYNCKDVNFYHRFPRLCDDVSEKSDDPAFPPERIFSPRKITRSLRQLNRSRQLSGTKYTQLHRKNLPPLPRKLTPLLREENSHPMRTTAKEIILTPREIACLQEGIIPVPRRITTKMDDSWLIRKVSTRFADISTVPGSNSSLREFDSPRKAANCSHIQISRYSEIYTQERENEIPLAYKISLKENINFSYRPSLICCIVATLYLPELATANLFPHFFK